MRKIAAFTFVLALFVSACDQQGPETNAVLEQTPDVALRVAPEPSSAKKGDPAPATDGRAEAVEAYIAQVNADFASRGLGLAIQKAEWVGGGTGDEAGQTVFAKDRTLRLDAQWVPGDARRDARGNTITYVVDQTFAVANTFNAAPPVNGEPAIDASFDTWNAVNCSKLDIAKLPDTGQNYSTLLTIGGQPGNPFYADISTIGFLPGFLFDAVLGPGASSNVLGVTFTFVFLNGDGTPSDVNNDGYDDTALKEVWYNDAFRWSTNGGGIDIETVALHENGHALGLGHFGKIAITNSNGKLHVSPRAVMNAIVLGTLRSPKGTDNGAYCGLYASWPR